MAKWRKLSQSYVESPQNVFVNLTPFSHLQNEKLLGICSKSRLVSIYANIFFSTVEM